MLGTSSSRDGLMLRTKRLIAHGLRSRRAPWAALAIGASVALLVLGSAFLSLRRDEVQQRILANQIESLKEQVAVGERAAAASAARTSSGQAVDFVQRLEAAPDVRAVLAELDRSTRVAGVTFGGVQAQERTGSPEQLARVDLMVSLRGNYPRLKQVLAEVLGRFPNVTLAQWRLRRINQPGELEATMVLALWGAATGLSAGANGRERGASEEGR